MKHLARVTLVAAIAAALLVLPMRPAGACSCAFAPASEHLRNATVAFVGEAEMTVEETNGLVTTFAVDLVYKGASPKRVRVSTAPDEAACGVPFIEGRTYAVFAAGDAVALTTTLCSGTTDDLSYVAGFTPITVVPSSPRGAPHESAPGESRAGPIALAGLLVAILGAASWLAVRASRRPRPIA